MGSPLYDFLTESFLFREDHIDDNFDHFSGDELRDELDLYREHALENAPDPSSFDSSKYRLSSGANTVPIETLVQGAFYVEEVITNDPLFNLTHRPGNVSRTMSQALGYGGGSGAVDRKQLKEALLYLKEITPMVASDYVVPLPISHVFEPPTEIPFYNPEDYYSGLLPDDLREWFWERMNVSSLEQVEGGWLDRGDFEISRGISVNFEGRDIGRSFLYHLQEFIPVDYDEDSRKARVKISIPDEMPDKDHFIAWAVQSVNASAHRVFQHIQTEASLAYDFGASYLAPHSLAFELLQQTVGKKEGIPTHTANTLLDFDLPLISDVDVDTLMKIRNNEGEAFASFRTEIERLFRELRSIEDEDELQARAEDAIHEITTVQVQKVKTEVQAIKKKLPWEVGLTALSLSSGIVTGGISTVATLAAAITAAKAGITIQEHRSEAMKHPAYFLWKVQNGKP